MKGSLKNNEYTDSFNGGDIERRFLFKVCKVRFCLRIFAVFYEAMWQSGW